jgi:hypothetical protein
MLAHAQQRLRIPALVFALGACSVYDNSLLSSSSVLAAGEAGKSGAEAGTAGGSGASGGLDDSDAGAAGSAAAAGDSGAPPLPGAGSSGSSPAGAGGYSGGAAGTPAGGSAGAPQAGGAGAPVALMQELISNMESGTTIDAVMGRNGDFYAGHDTTATGSQFPGSPFVMSAVPSTDPRYATSKTAAMTDGMGFTDWGENLGFNLNLVDSVSKKHPLYDASPYCGLHFFAKVGDLPASPKAYLRVIDKYSHPDGGVCGLGGMPCYQYYQKLYSFTPTWSEVSVLFTDLTCAGNCLMPALDTSHVIAVEFGLAPNSKFELWLDDISFLKKPTSGSCPSKL